MRIQACILALFLLPRVTWACATCFGAEGDPQTEGLNMAIITLLGVTYTLFGAMALFVFLKWRKLQRAVHTDLEEQHPSIEEGTPSHG